MDNPLTKPILTPINVTDIEIEQWSEKVPLVFRVAYQLAKYMPRGKGWFPRWLGRRFGNTMKLTIKTASGALLAVDPGNLDIYTSIILKGRTWDQQVLNACKTILRPGHVFYDIGANAGLISIEIANLFQDKVNVYAFEPQPYLAYLIAVSASINHLSNLNVYEVMLGQEEGTATLFIPSHAIHASSISREAQATELARPITTLDAQIQNGYLPPPKVIKIDVEGSELDVFQGAKRTIQEYAPYIIFEADANMERFGYTRQDLLDYLLTLVNYRFFFVTQDGFRMIENIKDERFGDMIAVPPGEMIPLK